MADNFGIHRGTPTPQTSNAARMPVPQTTNAVPVAAAAAAAVAAGATAPASASTVTRTTASGGTAAIQDDRTQGQVLSDFLHQLEDYTPTIPDAVSAYFCQTAGFEASDPRIVRLISISAQKFISDVANDALQHCKTRTSNAGSHASSKNQKTQNNKDRKYTLTMEDLAPALSDYGITVRKAHYFV
ncbi:transcription initiation factor TFIID subunit 10-like [Sitodiplosis mosellana]|uniref:transcription initiation factor TFIID subunit 10-like n=1 Tax=Sitodiplosis mosellana TaxID=263140 RepID=UPI00244392F0|nr:transcription initiation factor TFIID subunit 10-like [Sitodiplosis mosellana]